MIPEGDGPRSIAELWELYRTTVMPKTAREYQVIETRRAVYATCAAMMGMLENAPDDDEAQWRFISGLKKECEDFKEQVLKGKA